MSTYNGEKYIEEQISSILNQDYPNIDILIRDDGSTDGTVSILKQIQNKNIMVLFGKNLGYKNSFFSLMESVPSGYDYYAFSDQDDYWLPQKISQGIIALQNLSESKPVMYCSRLTLTDSNLHILGPSTKLPFNSDYRRSFFSNIATGCTMIFNEKTRILALIGKEFARGHDSWIYMVVSYLGEIFVDNRSFIYYRQHGHNTLGMNNNPWDRTIRKIRSLLNGASKFGKTPILAKGFFDSYGLHLSHKQRRFVEMVANYRSSIEQTLLLAFSNNLKTNTAIDTIALRLLIAFRLI